MSKAPRILVLQVYTKQILGYARTAFLINTDYCLKYGYDFRIADVGYLAAHQMHPAWGKVYEVLFDLLGRADYDYIWVLDADAIVVNPAQKLEAIIAGKPDAVLHISENGRNGTELMNSGSFIVKKSPDAVTLFQKLFFDGINTPKRKEPLWEQSVLNDIYAKDPALAPKVNLLPMHTLNSWWKDEAKDCPFVWHLMARFEEASKSNAEKARLFQEYYQNVHLPAVAAGKFARTENPVG